jgi:hypothetical protein
LAVGVGAAAPAWTQARIQCTPKTVQVGTAASQEVSNPIARALEASQPGSVIELAPGDYPAFAVGFSKPADDNAVTSGGSAGRPVRVRARGAPVRILPHAQGGDTIAFVQQVPHGHLVFEGLTILPSYRAAVMFYQCAPQQSYASIHFLDCHIEGGFDHLRQRGPRSKWGVWGQGLSDFQWRGLRGRSKVLGIQEEHAFYLQNPRGPIWIENVDARELGRTFLQLTARAEEGPPGRGKVVVKNCRIEDVCLSAGDGFKGGSALTFAGRHQGTIWLEGNVVRAGFDPRLHRLSLPGEPYGTSALAVWDSEGQATSELVLVDNRFEFAPGTGDRALVSLRGLKGLWLGAGNQFTSGGKFPALEIEPSADNGQPCPAVLKALRVTEAPRLAGGSLTFRGRALEPGQLARALD